MNADQLTGCMHAVLDGTATPEQAMLLASVLASDAEAAEEFESWKAVFRGLAAIAPAHPPEGLVAAIEASIPMRPPRTADRFAAPDQLLPLASVVASTQPRGIELPARFRALFQRPSRPNSTQEHGQMNVNRKYWAGGAIVVVALGVAVLVSGYPPKSDNLLGTVVPAERYRAPQAGAEAIKLGEPATAQTVSTGAVANQAARTEAQTKAEQTNAQGLAQQNDAKNVAQQNDAKNVAQQNDAKNVAQQNDAKMMAQQNDAKMVAQQNDAKMMAQQNNAKNIAQQNDARMQAQKTDASMQAQRSNTN